MRNPIRVAALVSLALALSACSKVVDPAKADPLNTAAGFCKSFQDVYERLVVQCGYTDAATFDPQVMMMRLGCDNLGAAVDAGRVDYVRSIAESCLDQFSALTCANADANFQAVLMTCVTATPGKVAVGGSCNTPSWGFNSECVLGATCDSSASCPGTCVAPGSPYQPCSTSTVFGTSGRCVDGYYCATAAVAPYPANTCLPAPSTAGALCGTTDYKCNAAGGTPLYCGYDSVVFTYSCNPAAAHGADCQKSDHECALATDYCRWSSGTYLCATIPTTLQPVGGDCGHLGNADCQAGLVCDYSTDTCVTPTPLGAACDNSTRCPVDAHCSMAPTASSGVCTSYRRQGESCTVGNDDCRDGWCAGPTGGLGYCMGDSPQGGACGYQVVTMVSVGPPPSYNYDEYASCAAGLYCPRSSYNSTGSCAPWGGVGTNCADPNYSACGEPFTGLVCDQDSASPTYQTCVANACSVTFGLIGF